jgi:hypothetical protein
MIPTNNANISFPRLQLPDLRYIDCTVDFSIKTFNTVINLCNELGKKDPIWPNQSFQIFWLIFYVIHKAKESKNYEQSDHLNLMTAIKLLYLHSDQNKRKKVHF